MSLAEAQENHDQLIEFTEAFMTQMEVPSTIIESFIATPAGEMHTLSSTEFDKLRGYPPSTAEWFSAQCGYVSQPEMSEGILYGYETEIAEGIEVLECNLRVRSDQQFVQLTRNDEFMDRCVDIVSSKEE
jgi:hypothetical protein